MAMKIRGVKVNDPAALNYMGTRLLLTTVVIVPQPPLQLVVEVA